MNEESIERMVTAKPSDMKIVRKLVEKYDKVPPATLTLLVLDALELYRMVDMQEGHKRVGEY